ncbi:MAG: hypothetical protein N2039_01300, partial [Gemmataceae bacterium]|nr:hypothetical protein [Gemmataceae bacterium]
MRPLRADPISQRLFLAAERIHQPNAFLARELADRIVDWLLEDPDPLDEAELHEQVVKLVREFGHPALALAYAAESQPPSPFPPGSWPRDVDSLLRSGLLHVQPDSEHRLADVALSAPLDLDRDDGGLPERLRRSAQLACAVTLDHVDDHLARRPGDVSAHARAIAQVLIESATQSDLVVSVHLNTSRGNAGNQDEGLGPLFADWVDPVDEVRRRAAAVALAEALVSQPRFRIYWHIPLAERSGLPPAPCPDGLCRLVDADLPLVWVFDRPSEPISLGPGLSRRHRSVLLYVGCHLLRLVEQLAPTRIETYLEKLATLAGLARSAARHRLHRLRAVGAAELAAGFLLERSRFVLVPIGLEATVMRLAELVGPAAMPPSELAERIVRTMRQVVEEAPGGPPWGVLDGIPGGEFHVPGPAEGDTGDRLPWGLTSWDATAGLME